MLFKTNDLINNTVLGISKESLEKEIKIESDNNAKRKRK